MNIAQLPIAIDHKKIAKFCRARGIRKMSLYGSVLRDDFDPERSDVDVLVEYFPGSFPGWDIFVHGQDLEALLRRKVDINRPQAFRDPFRERILGEALPLYERA
jgi:predicted nucleotidyltransferase